MTVRPTRAASFPYPTQELSSCVTKDLDAIGSMEPIISDFSLLVSGEHGRSAHRRPEFASEMPDDPAIVAELKKLQLSLPSRSNEHAAGSPKLAPKKSPAGTSTARPAEPPHGKPGTGNSLAWCITQLAAATGLLAGSEHCQVECATSLAIWVADRPSVAGRLREHGNRRSICYA